MKIDKISVSDPNLPKRLYEAFATTGFAVITDVQDVGITRSLVDDVYAEWKKFFSMSEQFKLRFKAGEDQEGYFPFGSENAKDSKLKDLKEFYHDFGRGDLPSMILDTTYLFEELLELTSSLMWALGRGMPRDLMLKVEAALGGVHFLNMTAGGPTLLRAIHYPPLDGLEEEGQVRSAPHEDINLITLLPVATAPGLQVKDRDGNWHDVGGEYGDVVVNVGDMLQELTGGALRSTTHRVVNPPKGERTENTSRYSMPFFVHARPDVRLSDRYTAGEYLAERLKEIGLK